MSIRKTLSQGFSMVRGVDSGYYTLQFLDPVKKYRVGDTMPVVVDYIEIGRDPRCAIYLGDEYPTVSRKHACIEKRGNEIILRNLSSTNPTFVNGREEQQAILRNGDEIQLSRKGPRMRYYAATANSRTGAMGMTQRLQLFAQQSLRPLRYGIAALLFLLLGTGILGAYLLNKQGKETKGQIAQVETTTKAGLDSINTKTATLSAETKKNLQAIEKKSQQDYKDILKKVKGQMTSQGTQSNNASSSSKQSSAVTFSSASSSNDVNVAQKLPKGDVYIIELREVKITMPDGEIKTFALRGSGTGFMCNDGSFVTARHVIQPWRWRYFLQNSEDLVAINIYETLGGQLDVTYMARSSEKPPFNFIYDQVLLYGGSDVVIDIEDLSITEARDSRTDWAYVKINHSSNITYDPTLARKLPAGEPVYMLGYTEGLNYVSKIKLDPLYSHSTVAQTGLTNGMINVSDRSFGSGHSGGPVFVMRNDNPVAIGIVSGTSWGGEIGVIVPLPDFKSFEE